MVAAPIEHAVTRQGRSASWVARQLGVRAKSEGVKPGVVCSQTHEDGVSAGQQHALGSDKLTLGTLLKLPRQVPLHEGRLACKARRAWTGEAFRGTPQHAPMPPLLATPSNTFRPSPTTQRAAWGWGPPRTPSPGSASRGRIASPVPPSPTKMSLKWGQLSGVV